MVKWNSLSRHIHKSAVVGVNNFKQDKHNSCSWAWAWAYSRKLKCATNPTSLFEIHAQIVTSGAARSNISNVSLSLSNNLMDAYFRNGLVSNALELFNQIPHKNLFSWTILISGFTKNRLYYEAVDSFANMVATTGLLPNEVTISTILPAFANLGLTLFGKSLHCFWIRRGFHHNLRVHTCFIHMYSRFGSMATAQLLFDQMPFTNLVSWNVLLSGYSANGMPHHATYYFNLMRRGDTATAFSLDSFTITTLISASSHQPQAASAMHGFTITMGYTNHPHVQPALIHMYTSTNLTDHAYAVFNEIDVKELVASTLILKAFSSANYCRKAMEHLAKLFTQHYMSLDSTALVIMISSCSSARALSLGSLLHSFVLKTGFTHDVFVGTAPIDMYATFCDIHSAKNYFDALEKKDITCWNAMISTMGVNGNGTEAIALLWKMEDLGFFPNEFTFVSILSACSHAGMVDEGLRIFNHMVKIRGVVPNSQHYSCLIDLLGRSGRLDEAHLVIAQMPLQPRLGAYGALLSACTVYGNTEVGAEIYEHLLKLDRLCVGHLSSVSNLFSSVGDWDSKEKSHVILRSKGMKKDPGCSLIDRSK